MNIGELNGELREYLFTMLISSALVLFSVLVFIDFPIVTIPGLLIFSIQLSAILCLWKSWLYSYFVQLLISIGLIALLLFFVSQFGYSNFKLVSAIFVVLSLWNTWGLRNALRKFHSKIERSSSLSNPMARVFSISLKERQASYEISQAIEESLCKETHDKSISIPMLGHYLEPHVLSFAPGEFDQKNNWIFISSFYSTVFKQPVEFIYETREQDHKKACQFFERVLTYGSIGDSLIEDHCVGPFRKLISRNGLEIVGSIVSSPPQYLPHSFKVNGERIQLLYLAGIDSQQLKQMKNQDGSSDEDQTRRVRNFLDQYKVREFGICNLP